MVYVNDDTARTEVYVRGFRPAGGKWQISRNGGTHPIWSPDGREVIFLNNGNLLSATISRLPKHFAIVEPVDDPKPAAMHLLEHPEALP